MIEIFGSTWRNGGRVARDKNALNIYDSPGEERCEQQKRRRPGGDRETHLDHCGRPHVRSASRKRSGAEVARRAESAQYRGASPPGSTNRQTSHGSHHWSPLSSVVPLFLRGAEKSFRLLPGFSLRIRRKYIAFRGSDDWTWKISLESIFFFDALDF